MPAFSYFGFHIHVKLIVLAINQQTSISEVEWNKWILTTEFLVGLRHRPASLIPCFLSSDHTRSWRAPKSSTSKTCVILSSPTRWRDPGQKRWFSLCYTGKTRITNANGEPKLRFDRLGEETEFYVFFFIKGWVKKLGKGSEKRIKWIKGNKKGSCCQLSAAGYMGKERRWAFFKSVLAALDFARR